MPPATGIDLEDFARSVKERRKAQSLSVRQAAAEAQVSFSTITRVENGAQPDLTTYMHLCAWLGRDPSHFANPSLHVVEDPIESAVSSLNADPRLGEGAAESMITVMREMYQALAAPPIERPVVAAHLRAATMLRPGVPDRLAELLRDMEDQIRRIDLTPTA